jgi:hypothetical protein
MSTKLLLGISIASVLAIGAVTMSPSGQAQSARLAEMIGFHQLCNQGDRKACIRFGIMIGENRERHAEWRRSHPEFWWWER